MHDKARNQVKAIDILVNTIESSLKRKLFVNLGVLYQNQSKSLILKSKRPNSSQLIRNIKLKMHHEGQENDSKIANVVPKIKLVLPRATKAMIR